MFAAPANDSNAGIPRHIAIIMDGNGRWARARGLPKAEGHRRGAEAVREAADGCLDAGVPFLTLFAFSSENWNRPAHEVEDLMNLFRSFLNRQPKELQDKDIRLQFIGDRSKLPGDIVGRMEKAEKTTAENESLTVTLAVNYGGRGEILDAVRTLSARVRDGEIDPGDIDEALFERHLHSADLPEPDLIIRTSGEQRLSNFLLWQGAYAELMFLELYWPDFTRRQLAAAIADYQGRERRYGGAGG